MEECRREKRTELSPVSVQETLAPMAMRRRGEEEGREFQKKQRWNHGLWHSEKRERGDGAARAGSGLLRRGGSERSHGGKGCEGEGQVGSQRLPAKERQRAWERDGLMALPFGSERGKKD
jgi:hypothetical protein